MGGGSEGNAYFAYVVFDLIMLVKPLLVVIVGICLRFDWFIFPVEKLLVGDGLVMRWL